MVDEPKLATTRRCTRAATLDREMALTAPIDDGERIAAEGIVRSRTSPAFARLAYLLISNTRICLVDHFALPADRLLEIPRSAVRAVSCQRSWVRLEIEHNTGQRVVNVRPWESGLRRIVVDDVLECSPADLSRLLRGA